MLTVAHLGKKKLDELNLIYFRHLFEMVQHFVHGAYAAECVALLAAAAADGYRRRGADKGTINTDADDGGGSDD